MQIRNKIRGNKNLEEVVRKLEGYFSGWDELLDYYLYFQFTEKGKRYFDILCQQNIDPDKPYIVIGNDASLKLFCAFYLKTKGYSEKRKIHRGFCRYSMRDYAFDYDNDVETFKDDDIIFLRLNRYASYSDKSDNVMFSNVMQRVCRRHDEDQVTIILTEDSQPTYQGTGVFGVVNLYSLFSVKMNKVSSVNNASSLVDSTTTVNVKSQEILDANAQEFIEMYPKYKDISPDEKLILKSGLEAHNFEQVLATLEKIRG